MNCHWKMKLLLLCCGGDNDLGQLHIMARHYEKAEWDDFSAMAQKIGIPEQDVAKLYRQALEWAQGLFVLLS